MCNPLAFAQVAIMIYSAQQTRKQGRTQEKIANVNSLNLQNDATRIRNKGTEEVNAHRLKVAKLLSKQKTQLAANNADINSGSASLLLQDTTQLGEADARRIRSNYNDQASGLDAQAGVALMQGQYASDRANNQANATLLNATSASAPVAQQWYTNYSNTQQLQPVWTN